MHAKAGNFMLRTGVAVTTYMYTLGRTYSRVHHD